MEFSNKTQTQKDIQKIVMLLPLLLMVVLVILTVHLDHPLCVEMECLKMERIVIILVT